MRVTRAGWALLALGTTGALLVAGAGTPSAAPTTTLISKNAAGQAGTGGGGLQVFLRDRVARTTRQVSVGSRGVPANGTSLRGAISGNGRYVTFESAATNLAPVPVNPQQQIYLRDLVAGTTVIASVTNAGRPGNSVSFFPAVNDPGGVVFQSLAFNLLPPGTPSGGYQIYYHSL